MNGNDYGNKDSLFSTSNLISFILALSSALMWVVWVFFSARLDGLESGRTTPMSNASRITFEHFVSEHARIDRRLDDDEARLRQAESRIVQLEYEISVKGK